MEEPDPKRARVAAKTADEVLVEKNARNLSQRLPGVGRNATFEHLLKWMKDNYAMQPLADETQQISHWSVQTDCSSRRTFLHKDGTPTPTYHSLQSGHSRATPLTEQEKQLAKTARSQNISITLSNRNLGQLHWLEGAGLKAFMVFMQSLGYTSVQFERMIDGVVVDFCATVGLYTAPVQVKVARGPPGTQVNFNVNKADGAAGGRYDHHILICLVVSVTDNANLDCSKFDELPDVDILEAYVMKSSGIKSSFQPVVYDHTPGSNRGRENAYEAFRYIVGRDNPEKMEQLDVLGKTLISKTNY